MEIQSCLRTLHQRAICAPCRQIGVSVRRVGRDLVKINVDQRSRCVGGIRTIESYLRQSDSIAHRRLQDLLQCRGYGGDGQEVTHRLPSLRCFRYSSRERAADRVCRAGAAAGDGNWARTSTRPMVTRITGPSGNELDTRALADDALLRSLETVCPNTTACEADCLLVWIVSGENAGSSGDLRLIFVPSMMSG